MPSEHVHDHESLEEELLEEEELTVVVPVVALIATLAFCETT